MDFNYSYTNFDRYNNNNNHNNVRSNYCLICNDRSSGIHFGISTCEACKAFFRRTNLSTTSIPPPCSPNRCEINIKNRNNCPSCRFDKCKRLGMDRDNVIYGKPSKQQNSSIYQQDYYDEQLIHICNELRKIFQNIYSLYNQQEITQFGQIIFQLFYEQTTEIYVGRKRKFTNRNKNLFLFYRILMLFIEYFISSMIIIFFLIIVLIYV